MVFGYIAAAERRNDLGAVNTVAHETSPSLTNIACRCATLKCEKSLPEQGKRPRPLGVQTHV